MPARRRHIQLVNTVEEVVYESNNYPRSVVVERNALEHSQLLRSAYTQAFEAFIQEADILEGVVAPTDGSYLNFTVSRASRVEDSLDTSRGAKLMNVRPIDGNDSEEEVTLYLSSEYRRWFNKKLNEYDREPEVAVDENGEEKIRNRRNLKLVNAVSAIQAAGLKDFFLSREDFAIIQDGHSRVMEVWFSDDVYSDEEVRRILVALDIEHGMKTLVFHQVVILLVKANARQLVQMVHALPGITEFRVYHSPSVLLEEDEVGAEQWMRLIEGDAIRAEDPLVRIGVLDTGINPNHRLLAPYLPSERCYSAIASGNVLDQENHGTGVASLALYGDLTDVIYNRGRIRITSDLTSVKMYSHNAAEKNPQEMYALVTEDAIIKGRESGAGILCTAITDKDHPVTDATASSTSAAIDDALYNDGACDSLLLISAGNVTDTDGLDYPDYLYLKNIQDPAQAWNAITVGAYTNKVALQDPGYRNHKVIAPAAGLSPFTSTSVQWGANAVKPEILMEGGNAVMGINNSLDRPDDLSLVVAHGGNGLVPGTFHTSNATSAATGLAARLAAKIKYYNPGLNSLSIRALMIHSAEWTDQMKALCTDEKGINVKTLLHSCGYGVPDEQKAIVSSDSRVTFIAEDSIHPFVLGSGNKLKFGHMNMYKLPWPKELLESLADETVRLKITLSYYIKPSPGIRSQLNKYSFQSIRLKFDVCGPHEHRRDFENRIKRLSEEGEERLVDRDLANRWKIGIMNRNQGSIISDSFEMTGSEMAGCDTIAIYPSGGWFKNRPENLDKAIQYSLVVSLETPSQEVYNEVTTVMARIPVDIQV